MKWGLLCLSSVLLAILLAGCARGLGGSSSGWSPAVASEGMVYVGTKQGEVKALEDRGPEGVQVKWTYPPAGGEGLQGVFNTPVVGKNLLYVSGVDGYLYAMDKETGLISGGAGWRRATSAVQDSKGERDLNPQTGGPALDPVLNVVVVGSSDGNLYAFDSESGDPLPWSPFSTGDKIWSTPVIHDGVAYFGSHDQYVYAVSLKDGEQLWRFPTGGAVVARPLLFEDTVVIGSFDKKLYGIDADSGKELWQISGKNWFWAGAVANEGTIFAPSMDGNVYALNGDGNLLWKHQIGSAIVSTPALLPRGLVVVGKEGKLSLLDPNPGAIGPAREISFLFIRDTEIKAPLFALEDSVFVGAQDNTLRRLDVKGTQVLQIWCFHAKDTQCN